MALLEVRNLEVCYGSVEAVRKISFDVEQGQIDTIIGSNGAGKSSTLLAISNLIKSQAGQILFDGQDITHWRADKIVQAGLIQVPEGRAILAPLSVEENLQLGAWTRKDQREIKKDLIAVYDLFPRLAQKAKAVAGSLSGGEQQMLAIGRALMGKPKLLLLDEPSMGLAPLLINAVFDIIQTINQAGTTVLLVEQNARKALKISKRAYVLDHGVLSKQGSGEELLADPALAESFLGKA